jgi:hypothetical protein
MSDRSSGSLSGGGARGEKDVFEGHDAEDSDDNGSVSKNRKAKARVRISPSVFIAYDCSLV